MKTGTALVTTLFALASFPLLAQQTSPASQPNSPATQQSPPGTEPTQSNTPAASSEAPAIEMRPVNGELVSKLDSKTAKAGDSVVVQTRTSVKTADGTEIPKGSKLVGHILGVQPSGAGENSQVALQFDHVELKGGQSLPVRSEIQSITPAGGSSNSSNPSPDMASGSRPGAASPGTGNGDPGVAPAGTPAASGGPAAGTIVAKNGNIAIRTTSVPGVLLANNAPGQRDPRMAQASSILLGAKQDIQLDGGTQMVVGVSAATGGTH